MEHVVLNAGNWDLYYFQISKSGVVRSARRSSNKQLLDGILVPWLDVLGRITLQRLEREGAWK